LAIVPGANVGPFRILEPLGRGGMASVFKAYEARLDREVALKVLPREFLHDPGFAERFTREAKAVAKLEHPNIVPIYAYDIDREEGIPWMALRLVKGGALSGLLKGLLQPLPPARTVEILRGVAEALDYAHGRGYVHRDVKPQNILLDEGGRVYLADFGIAKMLESSAGLTATGMITGTPQYMAPEQATGTKVDRRADIYALGIVAYEMLTGRVPFLADTPVAIMMKHVQEPLPLPPRDRVAEPLLRAVLKCTAKKPEDRWPSAGAFVSALEAALEARTVPSAEVPTVALPPPAAPTLVAPPRLPRRPAPAETEPRRGGLGASALVGLGAAAVLGLAGLVGVGLVLLRPAPEPAPSPSPTAAPAFEPTPGPATARPAPADDRTPSPAPPAATSAAAPPPPRPLPAPPVTTAPASTSVPAPTLAPTPTPAPPTTAPAAPAVDPEVERLAAALSDRDAATRRRAALDLAALGPAAAPALPALTAALADRNVDVRLRAVEALGRLGPAGRSAVPALAQALRDADPMVRAEAAKSIGLHADAAGPAAQALGQSLRDPEVAVRREASRALARLGRRAEPALDALVAALADKDRTVKSQAARALGGVGAAARGARPALEALARDSDVVVSREARAALDSIGE
jgi:serine/threonine-protein kinase